MIMLTLLVMNWVFGFFYLGFSTRKDTNQAHDTLAATTLKSHIIYTEHQKWFETFRELEIFVFVHNFHTLQPHLS